MRLNKDMLAGAMFCAIGAAFLIASMAYEFGSIRHMGPAFFPFVLALLLISFGVAVAISGWTSGAPLQAFAFRPFALVLGGIFLFAAVLRGLGLPAAVFLLVFVSAYASRKFRVWPALVLAGGLAAASAITFIVLLGLPLPLVGTWMG